MDVLEETLLDMGGRTGVGMGLRVCVCMGRGMVGVSVGRGICRSAAVANGGNMDLGMSVCISRGMVRVSTDRGIGRSMDGVLESWEEVKVEACSHAWLESALAEVSGGGLVRVIGAGMVKGMD